MHEMEGETMADDLHGILNAPSFLYAWREWRAEAGSTLLAWRRRPQVATS